MKSPLRGAYGVRVEHLKGWLAAAKRKEREEVAAEKEHPTDERIKEGLDGTGVGDSGDQEGGTYGGVQLVEGGRTCPDSVW